MAINQLYDTWFRLLRQLCPDARLTRVRNLAWFVSGMYSAHSVHLAQIAQQIPGATQLDSRTRRLRRVLAHSPWHVRDWYAPLARAWLQALAVPVGEVRLIIDGTQVSAHHQLLMVALAFRHRAIPLAWTWTRHERGYSTAWKQRALLARVRLLVPPGLPVLLVGDSEFGSVELLRQLDCWGWDYVVQQKVRNHVQRGGAGPVQRLGDLRRTPGQCDWIGEVRLTEQQHPTHLLIYWAVGEKDPWLLATSLTDPTRALGAYRRRMWIDELFGDLKRHGVDLEMTHLSQIERLTRLTFLVALLYLWLLSLGLRTIKRGFRRWVDRAERRDLSVFQIGWRLLQGCLTNATAPPAAPLFVKTVR